LLVPDDVVCAMVRQRLEDEDAGAGFILDGFPRTVAQAEALEGDLRRLKRHLTAVVSFEIPEPILKERLLGRLTCRSCGAVFHRQYNLPKVAGTCDRCGGRDLYIRDDDRPEAVRTRLGEHRKAVALLDFYGRQGLLRRVDATRSVEQVAADLVALMEER
jgi:adenylate kinase